MGDDEWINHIGSLFASADPTPLDWAEHVVVIEPTALLRWNDGVLEQAWRSGEYGELDWRSVPQKGDE